MIESTDDIDSVRKNILSFKPDIILLNLYLKHRFLVWDVMKGIEMKDQKLQMIIVTEHDYNLFDPRLSQADGCLVRSPTATKTSDKKCPFF